MSFLKIFFGSSENQNESNIKMDWEPLNDISSQLDAIVLSNDKPAILNTAQDVALAVWR
jgi:hypothetical protein